MSSPSKEKKMQYRINDINYNVEINSFSGNKAEVTVNGVVYQVEIGSNEPSVPVCTPTPVQSAPQVQPSVQVSAPKQTVAAGCGKPINAPLPGVIIGVMVNVGDTVKAGQVVAVLEAMKMENEIQAEFDGVVTSVHVSQGDSILEGTPIVTIG